MWYFTICDDEPEQLSWLEAAVREWAVRERQEVEVDLCRNAEQLLFHLEEKRTDILLLDISMPGMSGITLAHRLRDRGEAVQIIFVTGLADHALEGYDVEAVSYLIKPVREEQLFTCLDRARERCGQGEPMLVLETPWGASRVKLSEVCYLESAAHQTYVRCIRAREPIRCKAGIRQLEEIILQQSHSFFQIHRSYLVNLLYVSRITRKDAVMDTGEALPVSRGRWEALNRAYLDYYRKKCFALR